MTKRRKQDCSLVGFLDLFGDIWTLLIIREALYGTTRFSEFQRNTGAAKNLLSDRLSKLVDQGVMERVDVGTSGPRFAYCLTPKGRSLQPLLAAMILWSNEHLYPEGCAPTLIQDKATGAAVADLAGLMRAGRGALPDLDVAAGPGASAAARKRFAAGPGPHWT